MTPSTIPTVLSPPPLQTPPLFQGPDESFSGVEAEESVRNYVDAAFARLRFNSQWQQWFVGVQKSFIGGIGGANLPSDINVVPNVANVFTPFLSAGFVQQINPVVNFTIKPPAPILPGEVFVLAVTQDGTGGRIATWDAFYQVAGFSLNTSKSTTTWVMFRTSADGTHAALMFWGGATAVNLIYSTQANLATLAGTLGVENAGLLVSVTDYAHLLKWDGAAWGWGPGESGSGYFADFAIVPTGSGWHACDGSAGVKYLKADGTTGTLTLPNTAAAAAYRQSAAAFAAAITAATVPTIGGHDDPGNAAIAGATASGNAVIGNDTDAGLTFLSPGGVGSTVALKPHSHVDAGHTHAVGTIADLGHQHNLTPANAPIALPGDPIANYQAITYFRQ